MKILQIHNAYVYPGGEDTVATGESALLRSFGYEVFEYRRANQEPKPFDFYWKEAFFSKRAYQDIRALIRERKPDLAHFHNSFFMVSPSAYQACFDAGLPVVQTLHNYRFLCAGATFFRQGGVCEECLFDGPGCGVLHGCWHGSSFLTWWMTRVIREYENRGILQKISRFVALSEFSRNKFIQAGWNPARIIVKPNCLEKDPGMRSSYAADFVLYVGALQSYKGISTLLNAWGSQSWPVPLKIVGSGPAGGAFKAAGMGGVEWLGQKTPDEVLGLMKEAACVVLPSECYENFPRVIIEAYACGVPVVASRLGAMAELVRDGESGCLFDAGDPRALAGALERILQDRSGACELGRKARRIFEVHYGDDLQKTAFDSLYRTVLREALG